MQNKNKVTDRKKVNLLLMKVFFRLFILCFINAK